MLQNLLWENEQLQAENIILNKENSNLELEMQTELENGLLQQKEEIANIANDYNKFIEKLLADKKILSSNLDKLRTDVMIKEAKILQMRNNIELEQENFIFGNDNGQQTISFIDDSQFDIYHLINDKYEVGINIFFYFNFKNL